MSIRNLSKFSTIVPNKGIVTMNPNFAVVGNTAYRLHDYIAVPFGLTKPLVADVNSMLTRCPQRDLHKFVSDNSTIGDTDYELFLLHTFVDMVEKMEARLFPEDFDLLDFPRGIRESWKTLCDIVKADSKYIAMLLWEEMSPAQRIVYCLSKFPAYCGFDLRADVDINSSHLQDGLNSLVIDGHSFHCLQDYFENPLISSMGRINAISENHIVSVNPICTTGDNYLGTIEQLAELGIGIPNHSTLIVNKPAPHQLIILEGLHSSIKKVFV